ncbi:Reelin [Armadillidium nasatum]|uniref:Reelin n=1 Tax=Armadillidium nasatum TaxID=96803 RepID=A0A5N5TEF8_9CRUS|nr:Reelin [Armadillidium nasatum]
MGHGTCNAKGICKCDQGFSGKYCGIGDKVNKAWLKDGFRSEELSPDLWESTDGAIVSAGCNPDHIGNVMFFSGEGHRFIETKELDTRNVKYVVFDLQIGSNNYESRCQKGVSPRDNVVLEYSNDNGLSWNILQEFESIQTINRNQSFFIALPKSARTKQTKFRWWQAPSYLLNKNQGTQAEWQLDNVMILANNTLPLNVIEDFSSDPNDAWFMIKGGEIKKGCKKGDNALVFSGHLPLRYAETWEFEVNDATIVQFDILPGCNNQKSPTNIIVEYSTNNGKNWHLIKDECYPPNSNCITHDLSSIYSSSAIANWTRITLVLPKNIEGERTRLKFKQEKKDGEVVDPSSSWAIDNIFIGDSCPWLCSGHGQCQKDKCICDEGFFGEFCVPSKVLPCEMLDTFNDERINNSIWKDNIQFQPQEDAVFISIELSDFPESRTNSTRFRFWQPDFHDTLYNIWAIDNVFIGEHAAYTRDLSVDEFSIVQFDIKVGCGNVTISNDNVTLEYSPDYGVTWIPLRVVNHLYENSPDYFHELQTPSVYYPNAARSWSRVVIPLKDSSICGNVRFRWWQGFYHSKEISEEWALDNVYIGPSCKYHCTGHGYCINGDSCDCDEGYDEGEFCYNVIQNDQQLLEDFDETTLPSNFVKWSGADVSSHCDVLSGQGLLFWQQGERMLITKDLDLTHGSVVQFYLRLSCLENLYHRSQFDDEGEEEKEPIILQYSTNGGIDWNLISKLSEDSRTMEELPSTRHFTISLPENSGVRFAETPDIAITRETFIQFDISIGCKETNHCFDVHMEYSIDHGKTWHLVKEKCHPSDPNCPDSWSSSVMTSDLYTSLTQVTLSVPSVARSKLARFKLGQKYPWDVQHSWFVARTYVGDGCPQRCFGRGFCEGGLCNCHDGWGGKNCEEIKHTLPKYISDDFTSSTDDKMWKTIVGAKISELCGPIASGPALHFYGSCSRLLETVDIDLREALFIQFDMFTGCLHAVENGNASGDNSILVQLSCNAGITWRTLRRIPLQYHQPTYVWIEIPKSLRCLGGRVRWWQPGNGPRANQYDWALDSEIIAISMNLFKFWNQHLPKPAVVQTTDIQITPKHSIHFRLALGCGAVWDNSIEPVSLQYSRDFGRTWNLVRELCLPFNSTSCTNLHDESVFYAPQEWQYYVFPLEHIGSSKYNRFRWIQNATADVMGSHKWALKDVYIGLSCPYHCLGRGSCINQKCICEPAYGGDHCQHIFINNVPYIKDDFKKQEFLSHWQHIQGALLASGCGEELEEPPAATFQGPHTRALMSRPVDTRSARFVLFTAQIGSMFGKGLCRRPHERIHNVFLQYSVDGGITWYLLRELDHNIYRKPKEDYIVIPRHAMTPATVFRFWQPRLVPPSPSWSLDNVFIGGSEIATSQLLESFDGEPTISVGCQQVKTQCHNGPKVKLEFTKDGGANWIQTVTLTHSMGPSIFTPDVYSSWTRIVIPLPEKTWSSTTQLRWVQEAGREGGHVERILPWALDDVYIGAPCKLYCRGHGDCLQGKCKCDIGYEGETCEPHPTHKGPLPTSLIDGFEGGIEVNWGKVTGGNIGLGCNSLAPYGHGKHLYFNGCGTRQAITYDLDTRRASKVMFVLRIGSHDNMRSCRVDLKDPKRAENKGVVFQYSADNGITWTTIDVHNPLDFRKARRVAYTLPKDARVNGLQLRWWQPDHDGLGTDQWALDNIEIILAQRKPTNQFEAHVYHQDDL